MEKDYALLRKEDLQQAVILTKGDEDTISSVVMLSKSGQKSQQQFSLHILHNGKSNT